MTALVVQADANRLPLADETVDLVVTSPPYYALRSYQDGGQHYDGQVGSERTPAEYIDALLTRTAECVRVLKPTGSIWVNLGDKYAQPGKGERNGQGIGGSIVHKVGAAQANRSAVGMDYGGLPGKCLMGLPWRYALACTDRLGLILRAEVIWSKPNGLPESVTDRVQRSHEHWFHFTKEPRYFSAVDEIREPHAPGTAARYKAGYSIPKRAAGEMGLSARGIFDGESKSANPLGKLPGSVWTVATEPLLIPASLGVDHFAAFPTEWPRRIIQGWSPIGICVACGEGFRPLTAKDLGVKERDTPAYSDEGTTRHGKGASTLGSRGPSAVIFGYDCSCGVFGRIDPTMVRPAVVLDPFGGTGTTALVASTLGRIGLSCDLSHDYSRLARWRTSDPGERAKAMRVDKPPVQIDGQGDLFGEVAS